MISVWEAHFACVPAVPVLTREMAAIWLHTCTCMQSPMSGDDVSYLHVCVMKSGLSHSNANGEPGSIVEEPGSIVRESGSMKLLHSSWRTVLCHI